jgi:cytochrome c biogenesis protein CcmG/thiol:disulfide interchange protein DsbE
VGRLRGVAALLGLFVIAMLALAACSRGGDNTEPTFSPASARPSSRMQAAPDFELTLFKTPNHQDGELLKLSDLRGRPVVINFWFPSCPPCAAEMPFFEEAFKKHRARGVEFIGVQVIGQDTARDGQEFVDKLGMTYALGPDASGKIVEAYRPLGFPTTIFVNKDQKIVRGWTGTLTAQKLDELIGEILN